MENKEKLNQNPEQPLEVAKEENSSVESTTELVSKESQDVKAEIAEGEKKELEVVAKSEPQPIEEKVLDETPVDMEVATEKTVETKTEPKPVEEKIVEETPLEEPLTVEKPIEATEEVTEPIQEVLVESKKVETDSEAELDEQKSVVKEIEKAPEGEVVKPQPKAEEDKQEDNSDDDHENDHEDDHDDENEDDIEEEVSEETYETFSLEDLVSELDRIVDNQSVKNSKNKVGYIRLVFGKKLNAIKKETEEKFLEAGGVLEEYKPEPIELESKFNSAFGRYKRLRKQFRKDQEVQMQENLVKKNELLEEMRELVSSDESLKETYDKFNEIQNRWKAIGMVPKTDIQLLWNNYHFLVEKFFDKVKINKELRDLDLKKNLESKIDLCEKVEELLIEKSINKSFKLLQEYHNEWKAIGPVPSSNNEEIWERFKTASDKLNERRKEHYEQLQEKLEENLQSKQALCAKAEELALKPIDTNKEWAKRTQEMEDLFKVWRTFGPAPRKHNDEIWSEFKGYMNQFYEAKKKYFNELKGEQQENYHKKLDLVKQAEALKESTEWGNTTKILVNLQKEWKKIGPVPRKHSDDIWKQFRAANDAFFEFKAKHFKGQFQEEENNLKAKQELIAEIKNAKYTDDKKENLEKIKVFQRRWSEIGNVPRKEMDDLYKSYRSAVDEQLNQLNISTVDFRNSGFRDRIDDFKKNDNDFSLRKERQFIQKNMDQLKDDVLLWENNMGFFRNSKNADVLKMEFEKKIKKAKAEILVLQEKLRMIDK